ncbi:hypothetical protein [Mastigocoleus testarum]|uniref:hypothetical protein n=1 Tax=Mastigocoleus testarum TaxID=996925 RepID=UPI00041019BE|nr:hypothetical protein [Mastigocoleus testarum]
METTKAAAIEQQSLSLDSISKLIDSTFEVLYDIEVDLENILTTEFEQGFPSDLEMTN